MAPLPPAKSHKDLWPTDEMVFDSPKDAVLVLHLATLAGGHAPNINLAARPTPTRTSHAFLRCVEPKKEKRTGCQATLLYLEYMNKGKQNGPCRIHLPPRSKDNTKLSEHHHQPESGHSPFFGTLEPATGKLHLKVGSKVYSRQDVARIEAGLKATGRKHGYAIQSRHTKDVLVKCLGQTKDKQPCKWQVRLVPAPNGQDGHTCSEIDPKHGCEIMLAPPSENLLRVLDFFPEVTLEAGLIGKSKRQQVRKRPASATKGATATGNKRGSKKSSGATPAMTPEGDDDSDESEEEGVLSDNEVESRCFELISLCPPPPPEDEEMVRTYEEAKRFMADGGKPKKKKAKVSVFTYAAVAGSQDGGDDDEDEEEGGATSVAPSDTGSSIKPKKIAGGARQKNSNNLAGLSMAASPRKSKTDNVVDESILNQPKGKRAAAAAALSKARGVRDKSSSLSPPPSDGDDDDFDGANANKDDDDEGMSQVASDDGSDFGSGSGAPKRGGRKSTGGGARQTKAKGKKRSRSFDDDSDEDEDSAGYKASPRKTAGKKKELRPRGSTKVEYRPYAMIDGTPDDFEDDVTGSARDDQIPKKKRVRVQDSSSGADEEPKLEHGGQEQVEAQVGEVVQGGDALVVAKDESGRMDLDPNSANPPTVSTNSNA
ncbi:hypothetical protein OIV83_004822 [Microbotryomycetes sp. JL201]|nr:hypothetical protein OIV83_004822 [Microbotryomycetes sp. JL201]